MADEEAAARRERRHRRREKEKSTASAEDDGDRREEHRRTADEASVSAVNVYVLSENLLDKLKLLDYDTGFCIARGFAPIPRHFFAVAENANEQLYVFANLMSWLLSLAGHDFPPVDQYDDPNATVANIMLELRKLGMSTDFPQQHLKQGCGEEVCQILNNLAQGALKAKRWKWAKPTFQAEDHVEEEVAEENVEVTTEAAIEDDAIEEEDFDEEDDAFIDAPTVAAAVVPATQHADILQSDTTAAEWKVEVERVLPLLKVHLRTDDKDWRVHFQQMQEHQDEIQSCFVDTKSKLDRMHGEIAKTLEKIASREKYINSQLDHLISDYRNQQDTLANTTSRFKQASTSVTEYSKQLAQLSEELESVKSQMEERGTSMTDSGPLVKLKQSLTRLRKETQQLDLRIGVVQNTLMAARLNDKDALLQNLHSNASFGADPFGGDGW